MGFLQTSAQKQGRPGPAYHHVKVDLASLQAQPNPEPLFFSWCAETFPSEEEPDVASYKSAPLQGGSMNMWPQQGTTAATRKSRV